jgi:hypothetical protein
MRFYIVPYIQVNQYRSPRYFGGRGNPVAQELRGIAYSLNYFGLEPICLIGANVDSVQHTFLDKQSDVFAFPENIDEKIIDAKRICDWFELVGIPADWITSDTTYRDIIQKINGIFHLAKEYYEKTNTRIYNEKTLNSVADDSLKPIGETKTMTIREVLNSQSPIIVSLAGVQL